MKEKNYSKEEVREFLKFVDEKFETRADKGHWYKKGDRSNNFYSSEQVIEKFEKSKLEKKV